MSAEIFVRPPNFGLGDLFWLKERCNLLLHLGLSGELCLSHSKRLNWGINPLFSDTTTCHFVGYTVYPIRSHKTSPYIWRLNMA